MRFIREILSPNEPRSVNRHIAMMLMGIMGERAANRVNAQPAIIKLNLMGSVFFFDFSSVFRYVSFRSLEND